VTNRMTPLLLATLCALPLTALGHDNKVSHADALVAVPFPGHATYHLAGKADSPAGTAIMEVVVAPRSFGAPPHSHSREDEYFYVLEGEITVLDGEQTRSAGPGSLIVLPRNNLHGFWNAGEVPTRMLLMVSPGDFASFFDDVVAEIRATNPDNPDLVGKLIADKAAEYAVTVQPEKLPASARAYLPK